MSKTKKNKTKRQDPAAAKNMLPAASFSPSRYFPFLPVTRTAQTPADRQRIISRARYLNLSMSEVRMAVHTMAALTGTLNPRPASRDEEWNELARAAFYARANNPYLFDVTGRYNWQTAQQYLEKRAIIDGDVLTVMTATPYGSKIAVYPSTQLRGTAEAVDGVELNTYGRIAAFHLLDPVNNKQLRIGANKAILYRHTSGDVLTHRGESDLLAAILTAQDLMEINSYQKDAIKLAAAFSLIETIDPQGASISDIKNMRNAQAGNGSTPSTPAPLYLGGVQAVTLSQGHKLELLTDKRPSQETRAFVKDLVDSLAYSVGLDSTLLYHPETMGSASVRFVIAKAKDWAEARLEDRKVWANRVYQHIIAGEIAAGRLRPCRDIEGAYNVKWVNKSHWSIDLGRDAGSAIKLIEAGLLDADDYTLQTSGKTVEEIAASKLHALTHIKQQYEAAGLTLADYNAAYAAATAATTVTPVPGDEEPEAVEEEEEPAKQ